MVSIPIKHGKDNVLQLLIKRESIKGPIISNRRVAALLSNGPTCNPFNETLNPPAVQNAEAGNTVESRLHTARPGSFQWWLRRIEPEIHTGGHAFRDLQIVVR